MRSNRSYNVILPLGGLLLIAMFYTGNVCRVLASSGPISQAQSHGPGPEDLTRWHFVVATSPFNVKELHGIHRPVVRLAAKEVLAPIKQPGRPSFKAPPFLRCSCWYRKGADDCYGIKVSSSNEHGRIRRAFDPAFTGKTVQEQQQLILHRSTIFIDQLGKAAFISWTRPRVDSSPWKL